MQCTNLWMKAGTAQNKIHPKSASSQQDLPRSSAITYPKPHTNWCDTTSYIRDNTKRSAFDVCLQHYALLNGLGKGQLDDRKIANLEKFVCKIYGMPPSIVTTDHAKCVLYSTNSKPENLPPTSDALRFHIMRVYYQCRCSLLSQI